MKDVHIHPAQVFTVLASNKQKFFFEFFGVENMEKNTRNIWKQLEPFKKNV